MKKLINLFLLFLPLFLSAGPFGFEIGKSISDYPNVEFEKLEKASWYQVKNVPTPNKLMESYLVRTTEKSGICFIKALSKDIVTTKYGTELQSKYQAIRGSISKKYKNSYKEKKTNFLSSGSIWNDPGDYMMALVKKERFMYTNWEAKDSSNNIKTIFLQQAGLSQEKGYLAIEYYGNNSADCDALDSADDGDGF